MSEHPKAARARSMTVPKPGRGLADRDSTFRYTPSAQTDIRKTFARVRKEQRREEEEKRRDQAERDQKTVQFPIVRSK